VIYPWKLDDEGNLKNTSFDMAEKLFLLLEKAVKIEAKFIAQEINNMNKIAKAGGEIQQNNFC